jgi:hypothetical protein
MLHSRRGRTSGGDPALSGRIPARARRDIPAATASGGRRRSTPGNRVSHGRSERPPRLRLGPAAARVGAPSLRSRSWRGRIREAGRVPRGVVRVAPRVTAGSGRSSPVHAEGRCGSVARVQGIHAGCLAVPGAGRVASRPGATLRRPAPDAPSRRGRPRGRRGPRRGRSPRRAGADRGQVPCARELLDRRGPGLLAGGRGRAGPAHELGGHDRDRSLAAGRAAFVPPPCSGSRGRSNPIATDRYPSGPGATRTTRPSPRNPRTWAGRTVAKAPTPWKERATRHPVKRLAFRERNRRPLALTFAVRALSAGRPRRETSIGSERCSRGLERRSRGAGTAALTARIRATPVPCERPACRPRGFQGLRAPPVLRRRRRRRDSWTSSPVV